MLGFKGTFSGKTLVLEVEGARVEAPLERIDQDQFGASAYVASKTFDLGDGLQLALEGDEDEGSIRLKDTANGRSFAVWFNSAGVVDGSSSLAPQREPQALN